MNGIGKVEHEERVEPLSLGGWMICDGERGRDEGRNEGEREKDRSEHWEIYIIRPYTTLILLHRAVL